MKKYIVSIVTLLSFIVKAHSQSSPADALALQIPPQETYSVKGISSYIKSHFTSDSERVRAIFVWVSNNINYDVDKVRYKREGATTTEEVLKTRKAVCQGYSEVFVELCKLCNIKAILVPGYAKQPDGTIGNLSHAWVAAEVNNKWYLFDPTWAAGSVKDYQFIRRFSNTFYMVSPEAMIKDHMPFDPMYQFLDYPVKYEEFNWGKAAAASSRPKFNYRDTINLFNSLDTFSQVISATRRINRNGDKNQMVYDMVSILNKNQRSGESKIGYDGAVIEFNAATDIYNRYVGHKNMHFSSIKDSEIQPMIDSVLTHIHTAFVLLESVEAKTDNQRQSLSNINSALTTFFHHADDEKIFLKRYLAERAAAKK